MITGIVNADFEPIISISICDSDGKVYTQDAIVDTGFNGWLSLFRLHRNDIEETAVPCPYPRFIAGTRQCRVLISATNNIAHKSANKRKLTL